jgi:hypothetical protein
MEIQPIGENHIVFPKYGEHYSYNKATTCVHNLFSPQSRWVDLYGEISIISGSLTCNLTFVKVRHLDNTAYRRSLAHTETDEVEFYLIKFHRSRIGQLKSMKYLEQSSTKMVRHYVTCTDIGMRPSLLASHHLLDASGGWVRFRLKLTRLISLFILLCLQFDNFFP